MIHDCGIKKRDENGEWREIYNEGLQRLYRSINLVRLNICRLRRADMYGEDFQNFNLIYK